MYSTAPLPRCRYMRGGGAVESAAAESKAAAAAAASSAASKPVDGNRLVAPPRPLLTVYTEENMIGDDDPQQNHSKSPGASSGAVTPAARLSERGAMGASVEIPFGTLSTSFTALTLGASLPHRIAPIVPYGDEVLRKRLAADLEKRMVDEKEREERERKAREAEEKPKKDASEDGKKEKPKKDASEDGKKKEKPKKKGADDEEEEEKKKIPVVAPVHPVELTQAQLVRVGIQRIRDRLIDLKLVIRRVKNDGNCQFRALSQQLLGTEECHDIVRHHVVSYMKRVRKQQFDCFFENTEAADEYFDRLSQLGTWGDELTLRGASDSLFINIFVVSSEEKNYVMTYRPKPDAPPAPAFLVDVAKTRAAMKAQQGGSSGAAVAAAAARHEDPLNMASSMGKHLENAAPEEKLDDSVDAALVQSKLQQHLKQSSIQSAQPYFMKMGGSVKAMDHHLATPSLGASVNGAGPQMGSSVVMTSSNFLSTINTSSIDRPAQPPSISQSFDPSILKYADLKTSFASATAQRKKFLAAGAQIENPSDENAIRIFQLGSTGTIKVQPPAAKMMNNPLASSTLISSSMSPQEEAERNQFLDTATTATAPGADGESCPVFPHVQGMDVALVAKTSTMGSSRNLSVSPGNGLCFQFEAHNEPIDVFLSYLYPVHYNALAPDDGTFPNDPSKWFSKPDSRPKPQDTTTYVVAPFLKHTAGGEEAEEDNTLET